MSTNEHSVELNPTLNGCVSADFNAITTPSPTDGTARDAAFDVAVLSAVQRASPDGILLVDPQEQIVFYNQQLLEIWRIPPELLANKSGARMLDLAVAQVADPQAFLVRVRELYARVKERSRDELSLKDGRILDRYSAPVCLDDGDCVGRVWFFRDITERRQAELAMRASEERFRSIFDSVNDAIFVHESRTGALIDVNLRVCEMFGYSREEILALSIADLSAHSWPQWRDNAAPLLTETASDASLHFDWLCKAKDGHSFWIDVSLRRAHFGGHEVLLSTSRDITESRLASQALAYRDRVLHAVTLSVSELVGAPSLSAAMPHALQTAAAAMHVDRMLILERSPVTAAASLSYAWQATDVPDFDAADPPNTPRDLQEYAAWLAPLSKGTPVIAYARTATGIIAQRMHDANRFSTLLVPISVAGQYWGHIGIDDCKHARQWTCVEIDTLETLSEVIGALIMRERTQTSLQKSEERFRAVSDTAQDAIIIIDPSDKVLYWNRAAERILGYTADEAIGRDVHDWLAPQDSRVRPIRAVTTFAAAKCGNRPGKTLELTAKRKDGIKVPIELSVASMLLGTERHAVAILRDITERTRSNDQLRYAARHDELTGLANRAVFVNTLEQAIARATRNGGSFAVLYLDLDNFKDVNDTLGHPIGDLLLQSVAKRLRRSVRATDTVARFGGDEFALIDIAVSEPHDAAVLATKVLEAIRRPFFIRGNEIRSSASVGIAVHGPDSQDAETLLSHADLALYRAKSDGRGTYRFFIEEMGIEVQTRVRLGAELRDAMSANQLFLMYQPQVDIDTGAIVGVEALIRWHHPKAGLVAPENFIFVAEQSGLIVALGHWVLLSACRQMRKWLDLGVAPPLISVNVSGLQFKTPLELENDIAAILLETAVSPRRLELELTESVLMQASQHHNDVLLRLRDTGVRIAIDDFGTGYSSLDYLGRFPVDRIKIAQSFILNLTSDSSNSVIVKAAIGLANELKLDVIMEGVETEAQLTRIRSWGCRTVQGYYFSKPIPAQELTTLLHAGRLLPARPTVITLATE